MFVIVAGGDGAAFVLAVSPVAAAAVPAAACSYWCLRLRLSLPWCWCWWCAFCLLFAVCL